MKPIVFQIEYVYKSEDDGWILVKLLNKEDGFSITNESKLGNVPLMEYLNMPRKIDKNGNLMLDCFLLKPKLQSDVDRFKIGQIANLI